MNAPVFAAVVDDFVSDPSLVERLVQVCAKHQELKETKDASFNWLHAFGHRSLHAQGEREAMETFVFQYLRPYVWPQFVRQYQGFEWWANHQNTLGWHVDKDEGVFQATGTYVLPELSCVYYPRTQCEGGELQIDGHEPIRSNTQVGPQPNGVRDRIAPASNRLVIFSPGRLHRIKKFSGQRISIACNVWNTRPSHD